MTTQEFLSQAYKLDKSIRAKHERINMLKDRATRATSTMTALRTSGTPQHSQLEDAVSKYVDMEAEIADEIFEYHRKAKEVEAVIKQVKQTDLRVLLEYRYLCFMTWEQIAVMMNYSWRNIHYMHKKAKDEVCIVLHTPSVP